MIDLQLSIFKNREITVSVGKCNCSNLFHEINTLFDFCDVYKIGFQSYSSELK